MTSQEYHARVKIMLLCKVKYNKIVFIYHSLNFYSLARKTEFMGG